MSITLEHPDMFDRHSHHTDAAIVFGMMGFHGVCSGPEPVTLADIHMYDAFTFVNGKSRLEEESTIFFGKERGHG